jgi:hypothetical protein
MPVALVSPTGRYHGHANDKTEAAAVAAKNHKGITIRLLNDAEWAQVAPTSGPAREELCTKLGEQLQ